MWVAHGAEIGTLRRSSTGCWSCRSVITCIFASEFVIVLPSNYFKYK